MIFHDEYQNVLCCEGDCLMHYEFGWVKYAAAYAHEWNRLCKKLKEIEDKRPPAIAKQEATNAKGFDSGPTIREDSGGE